jgi:ABC-2 type transport system ATP-binding protein
MDPIIAIDGLAKAYGAVQAVRGISLAMPRGTIAGLLGPDGAGKTTTMRIVVTLLRADAGTVTVNGLRADRDVAGIRAITGYMPQRFSLYPDLSVEQNLRFFADLFTVPRRELDARMQRLYEFSRLEPFKRRLAGRLSGGMKQKLALSCTLIHDPVVLVLDEPTTGVDPVSRAEFWSLLRDLRDSGVSILVSTPYMDEAAHCDSIAIMHEGAILAQGPPASFPDMMTDAVFELAAPGLGADLSGVRALPGVQSAHRFGSLVHLTASRETDGAALLRAVRDAAGAGAQLRRIPPSLEDVFISLIPGANHAGE